LEERVEALHFPRLFVVLFCHEKSTVKGGGVKFMKMDVAIVAN
jgi:hypothetical protein